MIAKIKWTPFFNRNLHQRITTLSGRVTTHDETIQALQNIDGLALTAVDKLRGDFQTTLIGFQKEVRGFHEDNQNFRLRILNEIVSLQEDMKLLRQSYDNLRLVHGDLLNQQQIHQVAIDQLDEMGDRLTQTTAATNDDLHNVRNVIRTLLEAAQGDREMLADFISKMVKKAVAKKVAPSKIKSDKQFLTEIAKKEPTKKKVATKSKVKK